MSVYEPILDQTNRRFTLFPITYDHLWDLYKKQVASFGKLKKLTSLKTEMILKLFLKMNNTISKEFLDSSHHLMES